MRIVSQDGCYDLPYESSAIVREDTVIRCLNSKYDFCMGSYTTEEKAETVMALLRKSFSNHVPGAHYVRPKVFTFPKDSDVRKPGEDIDYNSVDYWKD